MNKAADERVVGLVAKSVIVISNFFWPKRTTADGWLGVSVYMMYARS